MEGEKPMAGALGAENEKGVAAAEKGTEDTQAKQEGEAAGGEQAPGAAEGAPAPGPGGEQFGGPDGIPFTPFPPNILTQDEIKKGDAVKLKGVLSGEKCKGHKVRIEVLTVDEGKPTLITMKAKSGLGSYQILVPKGDSKLWVTAICDVNGNNKIDINKDWVGAYAENPIVANADKTGVSIKFQKPSESPPKGFPPIQNENPPE